MSNRKVSSFTVRFFWPLMLCLGLGLMALVGQRVHVVAEDDVDPKRFSRLVEKMA